MKTNKVFSVLNGYSFSFEDEGNMIEAWFSSFTGLEKVLVNGKLVASQRTLSKKKNVFEVGENEYSTSMHAVSLIKGPIICTLCKNGKEYKRKKLFFPINENLKTSTFILRFLLFISIGIGYGIADFYLELPDYLLFIFLAALYFTLKIFEDRKNKNNNLNPKIVDEEII